MHKQWQIVLSCILIGFPFGIVVASDTSTADPSVPTEPKPLPAPVTNTQTPAAKVYKKVNNSIYAIYGMQGLNKRGVALGSAVAVGNHVLATNCHIALAGDFMLVKINNKAIVGNLFYYNKKDDLCLVVVPNAKFAPVNLRPSKEVEIGEEVFAIGNPVKFEKTISQGIISNKITRGDLTILQTDAPISRGSSGGGLFDINGNLIGITTKKSRFGESIGFAIPTELILAVMRPSKHTINTSQSAEKIITKPPIKASILKHYDGNKMAIAKWKNSCVIAITGFDDKKQAKSLAIWFPSIPNGFFIFPRNSDIGDAFDIFNQFLSAGYPMLKSTNSYLIFNDQRYNLRSQISQSNQSDILILGRKEDFTGKLQENNSFTLEISNNDTDKTLIKFDLGNFKQAFEEYKSLCKESKQ